ncbi:GbsR/MarR family transcriptional regulator [Nocardia otitidiscaviarum]|uniref:MarR family transcriptional regulator n=1 Tax=Nocardia otitidiscaviarum TaxID=1823 RepID=A0A516NNC2_9NOCA|nr:MarR family transcriptional regulator [Nocardia otitidiscaviarum]MBF6181232.1 MarR family transcriptional regulator [Nocardia otitidiscaviarum]MCP9624372.1 winged helix DNA-binding protein [Nocardia otitidiscaviarum]QDP80404.1 MarR family transcriptional regulator [Nocardia otitidiscaviarum]
MTSAAESNTAPTDAQLAFVEDYALVLEQMGLVRMVGRTVGWLLVCDPPEQTFNQITEALQASKGSISGALKTLTTMRWVDKTSKPGDRRDYYYIRPGILPELTRQQSGIYDSLTAVTARGLALFDDPEGGDAARIRDTHGFFAWMGKELPALIDRWEAEHGGGAR